MRFALYDAVEKVVSSSLINESTTLFNRQSLSTRKSLCAKGVKFFFLSRNILFSLLALKVLEKTRIFQN
jgi:hypothetical protein